MRRLLLLLPTSLLEPFRLLRDSVYAAEKKRRGYRDDLDDGEEHNVKRVGIINDALLPWE